MEGYNGKSITFVELLTLMLIYLKLTGQINYPWLLILSPIWISLICFGIVFIFGIIIQLYYGEEDNNGDLY